MFVFFLQMDFQEFSVLRVWPAAVCGGAGDRLLKTHKRRGREYAILSTDHAQRADPNVMKRKAPPAGGDKKEGFKGWVKWVNPVHCEPVQRHGQFHHMWPIHTTSSRFRAGRSILRGRAVPSVCRYILFLRI